ncbi:MAG TPA: FAD-dependent oxidoreductase [Terriglobia bacterium]|nr:FAD-dependent oxidoreductase [Terriglobia bacterium]
MARERLIVIGGVAAGLSAASEARRRNPSLEIRVYEAGPDISYSACGLPYFVGGQVREAGSLRVHTPEFFRSERNIDVLTNHEAVELSAHRRCVTVLAPGGAAPDEVPYDHLVLSTGARPARPDLHGLDLGGVFHVHSLQSTLALKRHLDSGQARRAVIVGGGYIGLEMAEALKAAGLSVVLLDRSPRLFEAVDEELVEVIRQELVRGGVEVFTGAPVAALAGDAQGRVRRVHSEQGSFEADCVVLATGARPRTKLAEEAGLQLGAGGAVAVNEYMETSAAGVFAAGDCADTLNLVSGRRTYVPLGTTANKQGRVAGENAAGGRARFPGVVGTAVVKVFDLEVARTGLSRREAEECGYRTAEATIRAAARARYLGGRDILVKLVADRATGRLLGAQMVGPEGVAKRIDVLAAALHARMTAEQVYQLDLSYAPPFSAVWDPILIAARQLLHALKGR